MTIIKCKMCGGDVLRAEDQHHGTCDSCGSTMTLPRVSDEQKANLFNRANHFRRQGEFDRAIAAYESILNLDNADAEAHWGLLLSRFGVEYVEDPTTGQRLPTLHRVQPGSILSDTDYLAALEYAPDGYSRSLYEEEAARIAELQRGILALSAQEKPYDVFICYKETDEGGQRTQDSALAQEVYYQLSQEGYKVFFSRITLEDKLGRQYEPYIFAALNSAKVMVVIGTKPEYFNAVWVKNEWSRFLALMKKDRSKLLIPCYRGMDPYDLPEALSMLQSQDMGKIGFIQDLVRGIKKVVDTGKAKTDTVAAAAAGAGGAGPGVQSLIRRMQLFLEDGDFQNAAEYADRVLDIEPENAQAYIGKLCAELRLQQAGMLSAHSRPLEAYSYFQRALRYADTTFRASLEQIIQEQRQRLQAAFMLEQEQIKAQEAKTAEENRLAYYNKYVNMGSGSFSPKALKTASQKLRKIKGYKDAERIADRYDRKVKLIWRSIIAVIALLVIGVAASLLMTQINLQNNKNQAERTLAAASALASRGEHMAALRELASLADNQVAQEEKKAEILELSRESVKHVLVGTWVSTSWEKSVKMPDAKYSTQTSFEPQATPLTIEIEYHPENGKYRVTDSDSSSFWGPYEYNGFGIPVFYHWDGDFVCFVRFDGSGSTEENYNLRINPGKAEMILSRTKGLSSANHPGNVSNAILVKKSD